MFGTRKLGKTSAQRKALLRQQVTDLLANGKMETTFYRAKEVQPVVEKMITLGKKGNVEEGLFFCGANVGQLDRMRSVRELMDELVTEWRHNL